MSLELVTPASGEPISTAEAKAHLNVSHSADDDYIDALISAARDLAETRLNRQILTADYRWRRDRFADVMVFPLSPVSAVTAVKYLDSDGAEQVLDAAVYDVDLFRDPAEIRLAYQQSWPSVYPVPNAVRVEFACGWADAASVPAAIKQWMFLQIGDMYLHRERHVAGPSISQITFDDFLLSAWKMPRLA